MTNFEPNSGELWRCYYHGHALIILIISSSGAGGLHLLTRFDANLGRFACRNHIERYVNGSVGGFWARLA